MRTYGIPDPHPPLRRGHKRHRAVTGPAVPEGFAPTGLHVVRTGEPVRRFQVVGERSSGTNLMTRLLARNTALQPTDILGWKHGFPTAQAFPPDLAVICMVRAPGPWTLSMHARPWHTTPGMQALAYSEFIRAPWDTIVDRARYFPDHSASVGEPLPPDRDPDTGRAFANLLRLRRAKLTALLGYLNRSCTAALVRLETLQADPETTIDRLAAALGQPPRTAPFETIRRRLGARFKPAIPARPATPKSICDEDRAYIRAELDKSHETALGYEL